METEYAEEARELAHQVATGTGQMQNSGGRVLAVCWQSLSVNYGLWPT
jgi:hypothetical protein